jgi:hypothetical protein
VSKPWAKYEIDFLDHAKFLALTANAICLWLEAKNYCDKYHTDGLFPKEALKTFRFNGRKSVELLMRSCGQKSGGEAYAPLWELLDLGGGTYRMHDYLLHNDCREVVLARIQDAEDVAELRRAGNKGRQQKCRADRKQRLALVRHAGGHTIGHAVGHAVGHAPVTPVSSTPTEAVPEAVPVLPKEREGGTARSKRPIFTGQRLVVFEWMLAELDRLLGPHLEAFNVDEWFYTLDARCVVEGIIPPERDNGAWLKAETLKEAQRRGLPLSVAQAPEQRFGKQTSRLMQAVANIKAEV